MGDRLIQFNAYMENEVVKTLESSAGEYAGQVDRIHKIGVDLVDESMKIYIDGHHTISYNMSATNCLAGSIGFKTFYSDMEVRNLTVANTSTPILQGLGLAGW